MNPNEKIPPLRALLLISSPKAATRAAELFRQGAIPMQYQCCAEGTASSEMIDILGLGSPEKRVLIGVMHKPFADEMLQRLQSTLRLGAVDSGIAFTLPLSGVNHLILHMLKQSASELPLPEIKEESSMAEEKYALVAAVLNQGYSAEAMDAARRAGASGGTVISSRRIGEPAAMGFWGLSVQEEKELLFIVVKNEAKRTIMQAISDACGMHSEAKGIVVSLPIDSAIGLGGK